jgi:hypothetical protein
MARWLDEAQADRAIGYGAHHNDARASDFLCDFARAQNGDPAATA